MVVAKRAPAPPGPARTTSAQRAKGRPPIAASNVPDAASSLLDETSRDAPRYSETVAMNGDRPDDPPSKKGSKSRAKPKQQKSSKKASRKGLTPGDFLFRIALLWITIYTLAICPEDVRNERPVCRALSEYRRLVLEPYVLPPIHAALSHPSVAPYVEKAKPYANRAYNTAQPVAQGVVRQWNTRVVPQWNRHVVPQWRRHIVPLWYQYAVPQLVQLDAKVTPYRNRVTNEYERRVVPVVHYMAINARRLRTKLRPYAIMTAHKTYDGYQYVAPYVRPAWEKVKALFVDPHVLKIWERVKELSSGTPNVPAAADGAASVASSLMSSSTHAPAVVSQAPDAAITAKPDVLTESTLLPSTVESTSPTPSSEPAVDITVTAASVATPSASAAVPSPVAHESSSISSLKYATSASESVIGTADSLLAPPSGVVGSYASSAIDAASTALSYAASAVSSEAAVGPASDASSAASSVASVAAHTSSSLELAGLAASDDPEIDLDAFAAELGLDDIAAEVSDSASSPVTEASIPPAPTTTISEEQKRKRFEETARKRAEVEARHSRWEDEQAAKIEDSRRSLRRALVALRKTATAELRESTEIRAEIESFVARAEDLLKGAEKYLQSLVREQRSDEEKRQLLERVLSKVQDKFTDRLGETEAVMNGWYAPWLDKELAEVRKVADSVKDHAENAQVDIGMDYAYLDDTTYQDWQRYHDLVRRSENFTKEAHAMQDGSSASPPANSLLKELKAIQTEVEDVVLGFETRLRRIRRNNARTFGEGVTEDEIDADDESVSILPIEDKDKLQTPADIDVPPVVIGRSKEEVKEALGRIVEADGDATSSAQATDKSHDPQLEVKGFVEAFTEQSIPTVSPVVSHEEL
ncbi:hypothetical protein DAEQUDRAFT_744570 [Daedalea quercina L-15889]|uniref:Transcription factor hoxa13 n=1 Tax=Daedalea quercina L-15889 TaxID=1314783 RepID=A0A165RHQ7_9APHY|nr:hypothetical protein DAEQUDRAFT_744570 [Daedalea quercina L-15889]